jgi:ABC-type amino acid transport substrate-binding protein
MTETIFRYGVDIGLRDLPTAAPLRIATLGPGGTSSESTAEALATTLACRGHATVHVDLFDTYEAAATRVLDGHADLVVVANAYAAVSEFYMNPRFELAAAFVKDTPNYGLAMPKPPDGQGSLTVASHPAPIPLIAQLMPEGLTVARVVHESSTSAAAQAAALGRVDAALTTRPAAALHGLEFFSRTRSIRMLWSVFGLAQRPGRPGARHGDRNLAVTR